MLSVLVEAALGLPAASTAPPAGTAAITVPALVALTSTSKVVLSVVVTALTVAVAVPERVTSAMPKPVTCSLKTTLNRTTGLLVGSAWPAAWLIVTVGAVASLDGV